MSFLTIKYIRFSETIDAEITVLNINGQEVFYNEVHGQNLVNIERSNFNQGIYVIKIQTNEKIQVQKLIIE